ncbi:MAG: hypothetical protein Q8M31_08805 [Beijerinckiaceae bacterium]|nr:hypothetical protein [Beijerinckiaceae bacterium]
MIQLRTPVTFANQVYTTFPVQPPCEEALRRFTAITRAGGGIETAWIAFAAAQAGWPTEAVRKIRSSDFAQIVKAYRENNHER